MLFFFLMLSIFFAAAEIFIPSFGVLIILSLLSLILSIIFAFVQNPVFGTIYAIAISVFVPYFFRKALFFLPKTRLGKKIFLDTETAESDSNLSRTDEQQNLQNKIGHSGQTLCSLIPGGMVDIDGTAYQALSENSALSAGQAVCVVGVSGHSLLVRPIFNDDFSSSDTEFSSLDSDCSSKKRWLSNIPLSNTLSSNNQFSASTHFSLETEMNGKTANGEQRESAHILSEISKNIIQNFDSASELVSNSESDSTSNSTPELVSNSANIHPLTDKNFNHSADKKIDPSTDKKDHQSMDKKTENNVSSVANNPWKVEETQKTDENLKTREKTEKHWKEQEIEDPFDINFPFS